jgi:hypothetical protein
MNLTGLPHVQLYRAWGSLINFQGNALSMVNQPYAIMNLNCCSAWIRLQHRSF